MTDDYLFGDSELAARRLGVLAEAFGASSRAFLAKAGGKKLTLAADLGCGPGFTTRMLADVLDCESVVGLDSSEFFIGLAEAAGSVSFYLHDVTAVPFPVGPCGLIYSRFVLTHQKDPEAIIAKWTTQLAPGGRLLLEETDAIDIDVPAFADYIDMVDAMLADGGYTLYIGPKLDALGSPPNTTRVSSDIALAPVTNELTARMFSMNLQTWKHSDFVQGNVSAAAIGQLQQALSDLATTPTGESGIQWRLRQIVYERTA